MKHTAALLENFGAPLNQEGTIRSTAAAFDIPATNLHALLKDILLRSNRIAVKPYLTEANIAQRLHFFLNHVNMESRIFADMMDRFMSTKNCSI